MAYRSTKRENSSPVYFLISKDRTLIKGFASHWKAKKFAKAHRISGTVVKQLGIIEDT